MLFCRNFCNVVNHAFLVLIFWAKNSVGAIFLLFATVAVVFMLSYLTGFSSLLQFCCMTLGCCCCIYSFIIVDLPRFNKWEKREEENIHHASELHYLNVLGESAKKMRLV